MGAYVHAITCSYTDKLRSEGHQRDAPENLDELVEQFRAEADFLRGGVGQGRRVTWAAIALTLAALALLVSGVFDATKVQVSLTAPAAASVANVCEWPTIRNPVDATIDRSSLDKRFVALEIHDCRGQQSIVRVRSAQIVTTRQ